MALVLFLGLGLPVPLLPVPLLPFSLLLVFLSAFLSVSWKMRPRLWTWPWRASGDEASGKEAVLM